jgi:hypothetical protein
MSDRENIPSAPAAAAATPGLSVVDPSTRRAAMAALVVGATVQYTELISGDRPIDNDRRAAPMVRAAVVLFVLDDGKGDRRPVIRVLVPNRPLLPGMPEEGRPMASNGLHDLEIYGPRFDPDPTAQNTWRPVPGR